MERLEILVIFIFKLAVKVRVSFYFFSFYFFRQNDNHTHTYTEEEKDHTFSVSVNFRLLNFCFLAKVYLLEKILPIEEFTYLFKTEVIKCEFFFKSCIEKL